MRTSIIFPDPAILLRKALMGALEDVGELNIKVATRKSTPQEASENIRKFGFDRQIIIRPDGADIFERVTKEQDYGINIFVSHEDRNLAYAEANRLGLLLEALLPITPRYANKEIKEITISTSPIDILIDTEEQQRYLTITAIILGKKLTI